MKSYYDYMDEISADELYEGLLGYGLFADKLPPIFTSVPFYKYCLTRKQNFESHWKQQIHFESYRNTNVPREFGIPNPMQYNSLCVVLRKNWDKIKQCLLDNTKNDTHKISRIHLRKKNDTKALFCMNYKNWKLDGDIETDLLLNKSFVVHADISTCFPSVYTHAIQWALVGKSYAKTHTRGRNWYNRIDEYTSNCKNGETHGILIGPHASNLLSEIVLTKIDSMLSKKYTYIRNIDDYLCYVETEEEAKKFLVDLATELRKYDLSLNHNKTEIIKLPQDIINSWERQLSNINIYYNDKGFFDYRSTKAYLDLALELFEKNNENAAILKYAIKTLPVDKMSQNAKDYCVKIICSLALLYPYLIPLLEKYVFEKYSVSVDLIKEISDKIINKALQIKNYEAACYVLYYAVKYGFELENINISYALNGESCLYSLLCSIYLKKYNDHVNFQKLYDYAKSINNTTDMDANWIFVYEILKTSELSNDWKTIKKKKISFLVDEFKII